MLAGLAMMPFSRRSVGYALRIIIAGACCFGIWCSWTLARADYLFQKDTEESVRSAIRLVPDGWEYYMRLAQFDRGHARELLDTALRLNRYDAQADIELGLQYEAEEDYGRAEKQLLEAYEVDHTYLPRWSLANYYFRRDNMLAFWAWARSAAEMPSDDVGPLFELCWRVSPDPEKISAAILNDKPELIRQYIGFLLAKDQPVAVANVAPRLVRSGDPETDSALLFAVVNRLVAVNDADAANALWHLLIERHWVVADITVPNNANFLREPLPVNFDWSLPEYPGLHSWPGSSGLETEFTGSEPEDSTVAEQAVTLTPGNYTMAYAYRTSDIPAATGIRWQILDAKSNTVLAESPDLSSDAVQHLALAFSIPPDVSLIRLRLAYRRALGTPRISGTLVVLSTRIQALPKS
jgi:tetratricopeptide (TPR) repeat protein